MVDYLEVDSVVKSYGTRQILTDIYLRINNGEIAGILGRNGSGKSTLLKIIFGSLKPEYKFVRINGKVITTPFRFPHLIQYLPQESFLPTHLTVKQVVNLYFNKEEAKQFMDDCVLNKVLENRIFSRAVKAVFRNQTTTV